MFSVFPALRGAAQKKRQAEACRRMSKKESTLLVVIHPLPQLLARLEMRDVFARHLHLLARLRVAPRPRGTVVQPEAAEPADLDAIARRQCLGHGVEHRLDRELRVLRSELAMARAQQLDELRFGHGAVLPFQGFPRFPYSDLPPSFALSSAPRLVVPALALDSAACFLRASASSAAS